MRKILKGDVVFVRTGSCKGKKGAVLSVSGNKVLVQGVNLRKRHVKPNPSRNVVGGIVLEERPIDISNVALFSETHGRSYRVGFVMSGKKKERVFKVAGEKVPVSV